MTEHQSYLEPEQDPSLSERVDRLERTVAILPELSAGVRNAMRVVDTVADGFGQLTADHGKLVLTVGELAGMQAKTAEMMVQFEHQLTENDDNLRKFQGNMEQDLRDLRIQLPSIDERIETLEDELNNLPPNRLTGT